MSDQEKLQKANEVLKSIHIKGAIPQNFEFNPGYTEENRDLLVNLSIQKNLDALGGEIVVENGEAKIVRKGNPDLELYDEKQSKVTLQRLVPEAIAGLGTNGAQVPQSNNSFSKQWISENEYIQDGITHTKIGHATYRSSTDRRRKELSQAKPSTFKEHHEQLTKELGINP